LFDPRPSNIPKLKTNSFLSRRRAVQHPSNIFSPPLASFKVGEPCSFHLTKSSFFRPPIPSIFHPLRSPHPSAAPFSNIYLFQIHPKRGPTLHPSNSRRGAPFSLPQQAQASNRRLAFVQYVYRNKEKPLHRNNTAAMSKQNEKKKYVHRFAVFLHSQF